jgi:hypothetical protein
MTTSAPSVAARCELATRTTSDLEVTLWWDPRSNAVAVSVWDWKRDAHFELAVDHDRALDVFHHPFSYASRHALDDAMTGSLR